MDKINHRKKYILVLDIETANFLDDAIAYDVGFAVADRKGNIYETYSFMIGEMFINNADLLQSAYYADKLPNYWKEYARGERKMISILTAKKIVAALMEKYRISDVFAYNASFDLNGLNRSIRYITKSKYRYFFPYGTKIHCIWNMACQTILQQKAFFQFAVENGLVKENGNVMTSAETAYRYICKDNDFTEAHTGLEDVKIETAILAKCYAQHQKMETRINRGCWQLPQKKFKNFAETY
jgi:hypothetical protein